MGHLESKRNAMNNYVWATGTNSDNSGQMGADSYPN